MFFYSRWKDNSWGFDWYWGGKCFHFCRCRLELVNFFMIRQLLQGCEEINGKRLISLSWEFGKWYQLFYFNHLFIPIFVFSYEKNLFLLWLWIYSPDLNQDILNTYSISKIRPSLSYKYMSKNSSSPIYRSLQESKTCELCVQQNGSSLNSYLSVVVTCFFITFATKPW